MESSNANYEVFNVGTGRTTNILEIAQLLCGMAERRRLCFLAWDRRLKKIAT
jgi:nucleoside-diphosphate-sugar epimerase